MAMERRLRFGVIGCGRVAQAHLAAIEFLKKEVELVAVADADEKRAKEAKERFGARYFIPQIRRPSQSS